MRGAFEQAPCGGGSDTGREAIERVRNVVNSLAGGWPPDYSERAVEWLLLEEEGGGKGAWR